MSRKALTRRNVLVSASTAFAVVVWFAPIPLAPAAHRALAITTWMVLLWILEPVDPAITGLAGCLLYVVAGCVDFVTAFSGFARDTTWFLFGAVVIGAVVEQTGLARRIAYSLLALFGASFARILLGLTVADFVLTLVVPSGLARVVMLGAICLGLVEAFGARPRSNVARAMFVLVTYAATIFDKMVIAGVTSVMARGFIQDVGQARVSYGQWFLAFLPCDLLTIALGWRIVLWLYPPEVSHLPANGDYVRSQLHTLGPLAGAEIRAAVLVSVAVLLWLTDFIHGIPAATIALGLGLLACIPPVGVLNDDNLRQINLLPIIMVAAVLSMATVLLQTHAIDAVNHVFFFHIDRWLTSPLMSAMTLYWLGFFYHFFLPEPSMIPTSMPQLMLFAKANGINPMTLGIIWTFATGGKIFVYQSPVLVAGFAYRQFDARDLLRVGFTLTVIEFVILLLLVQVYWPFIGLYW